MIRPARTEADLGAYVGVWNAITPEEPTTAAIQRERLERDPRRLYLVAERDGAAVGCGFSGPSDSPGRAAVAPRVLPPARRAGLGTALLAELVAHAERTGFSVVSAHVDGRDEGSLAFARRHGFEEVDRQVEQVLEVGDEPPPALPEGIRLVTIAERPELLREAYDLAVEGYADMAVAFPVTISLDDWLRDEATLPGGSFVALACEEIVGYSGLCRRDDGRTAEDGLTVVRRAYRGRGLGLALKRAELAWAAANGVREIVTWTQRANQGMRALNERLGYVARSVSVMVQAQLPL